MLRALDEDGAGVFVELDPLHDGALSNPFGPTEPMKRVVPAWTRLDWVLAACIGGILGLTAGKMRNAMSDETMFRSVAARASVPEYTRYLSQGGMHTGEVRDHLLPTAEIRDAEGQGDVEALRACAELHPSSNIQLQIDGAMRRVLLARLKDAESIGTVGALDEFQQRYPHSNLDAELGAARQSVYARALVAWEAKAHPDATTAAFMDGLLEWAEKNVQPTLEVRFQLQHSKTLGYADNQVATSAHYAGPDDLPSHHVTPDAMEDHEQRVAHDFAQAFAHDFAPDLLLVRPGDRLPAGEAAPANVPTLIISYAPEWAFATEPSDYPDTVFASLRFAFEATLVSPRGSRLTIESQTCRAAQAWRVRIQRGESRDHYEQRVYDAMVDDAFIQLANKLTTNLL